MLMNLMLAICHDLVMTMCGGVSMNIFAFEDVCNHYHYRGFAATPTSLSGLQPPTSLIIKLTLLLRDPASHASACVSATHDSTMLSLPFPAPPPCLRWLAGRPAWHIASRRGPALSPAKAAPNLI